MSDKIKVEVMVEGCARWTCEVEMTRDEYISWCDRIDSARGHKQTEAAEELIDLGKVAGRDIGIDIAWMRVEDFIAVYH